MQQIFHPLRVADIKSEIGGEAHSVTFDVPNELWQEFEWEAGQHLTLRLSISGQEERRSYTISDMPGSPLRITVKRVKGGIVSNYIGDQLKVGQTIEVAPPAGSFVLRPNDVAYRTHYFFAAGSGVTPIFSMLSTMLEHEPYSTAHFVYGNHNADSIIFKEELEALEAESPKQLSLRYVLSSPSWWGGSEEWRNGRIDREAIEQLFDEDPPVAQDVQYWICGPGSMNQDVRKALMGLDVPADRIHMESFGSDVEQDLSVTGVAASAEINLYGQRSKVELAEGQTVLEAMRSSGLSAPYSCESGVCGSCKAKLKKGDVHMRARMALSDEEVAAGEILTCQSVAKSPNLSVEFAS